MVIAFLNDPTSSTSQTIQKRTHLLSAKSERLKRDTFFFRPAPYGWLFGGLNQRLTPVTPATIYRWAKLCDPQCSDFELYPVKLRKCGILHYIPENTGPAISSDSTACLPAGDYSLVVKSIPRPLLGILTYAPFSTFSSEESTFTELKARVVQPDSELPDLVPWYTFPTGLEDAVISRDSGRCVITGSNLEVAVAWIFPPAWAQYYWEGEECAATPEALSIPANAMLLRQDLMAAFQDNAFGVDVDDNYRIVIFQDVEPIGDVLLPLNNEQAFFRRSASSGGPDDAFLRRHFRHCILVHIVGGDIGMDYSPNDIVRTMEALGVEGDEVDEIAPMDDPLWQTPLGREIFEDYMNNAMFLAGAEIDEADAAERGADVSDSEA